jgi:hypothetical protein
MRRREVITLLGGTAAACSGAWSLAARAQQTATPVVGVLAAGSPNGYWAEMFTAFRQGLGDAGYGEGRNMAIEARWAEDHYDRLPALAADLIEHRPAVWCFRHACCKSSKGGNNDHPGSFRHHCRSGADWAGRQPQPPRRQHDRRSVFKRRGRTETLGAAAPSSPFGRRDGAPGQPDQSQCCDPVENRPRGCAAAWRAVARAQCQQCKRFRSGL